MQVKPILNPSPTYQLNATAETRQEEQRPPEKRGVGQKKKQKAATPPTPPVSSVNEENADKQKADADRTQVILNSQMLDSGKVVELLGIAASKPIASVGSMPYNKKCKA